MKRILSIILTLSLLLAAGCTSGTETPSTEPSTEPSSSPTEEVPTVQNITDIMLSDNGIMVGGKEASTDSSEAVYVGADIVYYHDGTDDTYGEGTESEMHSAEEAAAHTVVTITQPGVYRLMGTLPLGQIAVDLGEDAKDDPGAVVTLILNNVNVTCTVAPALIFYNVYECDQREENDDGALAVKSSDPASAIASTSAAGANVVIAAGSDNTFTGSHVARIYKPETTKKLHKYDGAFYSKMSMNIFGDGDDDSGVLNIVGDNEGLDSEMHLTINGGTINITSQDDGINTNEDGVSVTAINGGILTVNAGNGAEGDGIDSNGYLVINGGVVWTMANESSPDGGIDADCPIFINGGTLYAFGIRNDEVSAASEAPYMELNFASILPAGTALEVRDKDDHIVWGCGTVKRCQSVTLTAPELKLGETYTVYVDGVLQCYSTVGSSGMGMPGGFGGQRPDGEAPEFPEGMERPEMPEGGFNGEIPEGMTPPDGEMPKGALPDGMPGGQRPEGEAPEPPEGMERPEDGGFRGDGGRGGFGGTAADGSGSTEFTLEKGAMSFSGVCDSAAGQ